jgi:hypothetical protein
VAAFSSEREISRFDTKYAMHMLRLGFQGVELLTTGRLSLPMREPARSFLLDVRRGKVSEQECLTRAGELEKDLTDLATTSRYLRNRTRYVSRDGCSMRTAGDGLCRLPVVRETDDLLLRTDGPAAAIHLRGAFRPEGLPGFASYRFTGHRPIQQVSGSRARC